MNDSEIVEDKNFSEDEKDINSFVFFASNVFEICVQAVVIVAFIFTFLFRSVTVQGASMENTLKDKYRMFIVSSFISKPKQKDVVVINTIDILERLIVKRIVAVEGQTVALKKEGIYYYLFIDGVKQGEEYIKEPMEEENIGNFKYPIKVPVGYVFVMGDNRNNSTDSRHIGLVNLEKINGICRAIYWPLRQFQLFW